MNTILKGKLTYIVSLASILYGAAGFYLGYVDGQTAWQAVNTGLIGLGLRRAIG